MNKTVSAPTGVLVPRSVIAAELGIHPRSLARWLDDPGVGFPGSIVVRGRHFFSRDEVEAWKTLQARERVAKKRAA
jgi:hypothetical protein